jgi:rfaE bifunctional protein kinase chain/domain
LDQAVKSKILLLAELIDRVEHLKKEGKVVVQSHGIFDLVHPGIVSHLNSAKKQGDVLVVTVIKDKDVRRGPGRPIFPENLRAETVASLNLVDYACLVDDEIPFDCVKKINPDIFAKGQAFKERYQKIHKKIFQEEKEFYLGKCKIYETGGFSFSSSKIINNFLEIYPEETKIFLKYFSRKYKFENVLEWLNSLKNLNVFIIGDGIIDEYHYCDALGKSGKAHLVVNKYLHHEVFAGGVFAVANHISGICDRVQLLTLLGKEDSREDFIHKHLKSNINLKAFFREDGPTTIKKRYINEYQNLKLFEINYLNDKYINKEIEQEVIDYLRSELPKYDLTLISDYGHGFITSKIIEVIRKKSKVLAVNAQTNSANVGYNLITKYQNPDYVCLAEGELRLASQDKYSDVKDIAKNILENIHTKCLIVTLGKKGSFGVDNNGEMNKTPIFSLKVVDTIGAGDAFFAFTSPCFGKGMPLDMISFIGNAVGALAVQITGNKKPIEKYELLEFIHALLK